jgi:alcohol dehydrogenase
MPVPTRTRSAVLSHMGAAQPFEDSAPLEIVELDLAPPGPEEVLVRIEAAGVCHSDLSVLTGQRPRPMPMAIGHEAAGVVLAVGGAVSSVAPGDHVVLVFMPHCGQCQHCAAGRPTLCVPGGAANREGTLMGGGQRLRRADGEVVNHHLGVSAFSEHAVVHHSSVVRIDADVPFAVAAVFGCAMLTGAGAVWNTAKVAAGDSVAVIGLGGVGLSAVIGAVVAGANPIIAIDPVESKLALARDLGATHTCTPGDAAALVAEVTGTGARWAIEAAGVVPAMEQAFALIGRGGTVVSVGLPAPDARLTLPAVAFVADAKSFVGSYMGSADPQRDIPTLIGLWRSGALQVEKLVSGTLPLAEVNAAMDRLADGSAVRQILLPHAAPGAGGGAA